MQTLFFFRKITQALNCFYKSLRKISNLSNFLLFAVVLFLLDPNIYVGIVIGTFVSQPSKHFQPYI